MSSDPVPAEVAQPSSSGPAPKAVGEDLAASLARQYQTVSKIHEAVARFEVKKRRTPEYLELGRDCHPA